MKLLNKIIFLIALISGSTAVMSMESDDAFEASYNPSNNQHHVNAAHRTISTAEKKQKKHSFVLNEQKKSSQNIESGEAIKVVLERRKSVLGENNKEK